MEQGQTLLEHLVLDHINTWTPEQDKKFEKSIADGIFQAHRQGRVTAYQVLALYDLHRYFPGQN